jgi:Mg2+-importing ATPase
VLFNALVHPFNILLIILAIASGAKENINTMCIMTIMVFLSTIIRFFQEWKSIVAAKSLRKLVSNKVCALRYTFTGDPDQRVFKEIKTNVIEKEIPLEDIVPGDWIKLSSGDLIPADIQLIDSKDLFVSQSSLTGEALPVEKYVANNGNPMKSVNINAINFKSEVRFNIPRSYLLVFKTRLNRIFREIFGLRVDHLESGIDTRKVNLDRPDLCYMGTSIVSGTATAIVRKTGMNTYFGSMAKELFKKRPQNAFKLGVRRISWLFFIIMACMVPPVLFIQGFVHHDWTEAFLFALSVAVGLTPEMLPTIVNATLARGAILMSRKKCIVKNLDSIINMGGMDRDLKKDVKYSGHVFFCIKHIFYELKDFSLISNNSR